MDLRTRRAFSRKTFSAVTVGGMVVGRMPNAFGAGRPEPPYRVSERATRAEFPSASYPFRAYIESPAAIMIETTGCREWV